MRPGSPQFFLLRRMLTPPERLLSSLSASLLSRSLVSLWFLYHSCNRATELLSL